MPAPGCTVHGGCGVEHLVELRRLGVTVATRPFGAHMAVELTNDGPVTLMLEV